MNELFVYGIGKLKIDTEPVELPYYAPASFSLFRCDGVNRLVDTGGIAVKNKQLEKYLNQAGVGVNEIDEIILTHLHPDHGGNIASLKLKKTAKVYGPDSCYYPYSGKRFGAPLEDNVEIAPGVMAKKLGGHETPFDQVVFIETKKGSKTIKYALVGDAFLNEFEFRNPEKYTWPSNIPEMSDASRKYLLEHLSPDDVVVPGHDSAFYVNPVGKLRLKKLSHNILF